MAAPPDHHATDHDTASDQLVYATPDDDDDPETEPEPRRSVDGGHASPNPQPPRRKGGRKPVYATVEERKQRNRQAQAAFRERRTEYIKQLESNLKQHEQLLRTAQSDQHAIAHDCSALRYKIATLEKIMAEKGIDVDAELRALGELRDMPMTAYPSIQKAKPSPIPLAAAASAHRRPGPSVRGLAPKIDPRGKMAQLEAGHAPTVAGASRPPPDPWQPAASDDQLRDSTADAGFRGLHPSLYGMQAQPFMSPKNFNQVHADFDVGQLSHGLSQATPFDDSFDSRQGLSRADGQEEDYGPAPGMGITNNTNSMSKLAHFDFYPSA